MKNKKAVLKMFLVIFFASFFLGGGKIVSADEAVTTGVNWAIDANGVNTTQQTIGTIPNYDGVVQNDTRLHDYPAPAVAQPVVKSKATAYDYTLLESFPGFFKAGDQMNDLPGMILAIYKFGIWTVGIAGLFMLVVGGFTYMTSAGNTSNASTARGIISDALLGIVAALGAYLILYVINPDFTKINISFVPVSVTSDGAEEVQVSGVVSTDLTVRDGKKIASSFNIALDKIKLNGTDSVVTSGLRTIEDQQKLIIQNCGGNPPAKACSPATCLLKNGPSSCPHTTGNAVDIWALNVGGTQAVTQKECTANINDCFNNRYQKALIAGMRAEGFCVLSSEPWHFEKPKMSSTCS